MKRSDPHFVYRCFDASGGLLYIGCTGDPDGRIQRHRTASGWFSGCVRITWEEHPNYYQAHGAEDLAIYEEKPAHNRNGGGHWRAIHESYAAERARVLASIPDDWTLDDLKADLAKRQARFDLLTDRLEVFSACLNYMHKNQECANAGEALVALGLVDA